MWNNYSFLIHSDIMYAINRHNEIMCGERLTLLDGAILCLVKSFHETDRKFFMSNNEMKKLFASDPGTIQRSVDRLVRKGLLSKEKEYTGARQRRYLKYNVESVTNLIKQSE